MPLKQELHERAQGITDRETAARATLAAVIAERVAFRAEVVDADADVLNYLDTWANPALANPAPIAPEVAAPAPAVEPPVYTPVTSSAVSPLDSSGGQAEVHEDLEVLTVDEAVAAAADTAQS